MSTPCSRTTRISRKADRRSAGNPASGDTLQHPSPSARIARDRDVACIIRENLKKKRLTEPFAKEVEQAVLILDEANAQEAGATARARSPHAGTHLLRQQERLHLVELPVEPVAPDELVVTAFLHNFSPEHDKYAVNGADGRKPVRDDEGGAVLQ